MKIILNSRQEDGLGDVMSTIMSTTGFINYLKNNHPEIKVEYYINDNYNLNQLSKILDIDYFNTITDKFEILPQTNIIKHLGGYTIHENIRYERYYSVCNFHGVESNVPGKFDVFVLKEDIDKINKLNLPFESFNWGCLSQADYYPIFKKEIVNEAENFVKNNFLNGFEVIRWRWTHCLSECNAENQTNMFKAYINYLENKLDLSKTYFFSTNYRRFKDIVNKSKINVKFYWDLDSHSVDNTPVGPLLFDTDCSETIITLTEILIISMSDKIHYSACNMGCSLFNWVAVCAKKVPVETTYLHKKENGYIINSENYNI